MPKRFENKVAVVTGGCRGIGKSIVLKLAEEGALVYALDYKIPEENEIFIEDTEIAKSIKCLQADVTSMQSVEQCFEKIINENQRVDILVNNAGITRDNLLLRMSEAEWDAVLDTNLKGSFICSKIASKIMISQRYGRIISIASVVGLMGNAGQSNYAASKAGLIGFTKSIARELSSRNILVNVVAPGYVRTQMTDALNPEQKKAFIENIPLKRIAEPEDIANAVAFLASDEASYITGQVLNVNGGLFM
jgi:3-oxoacyl-[acyl-carrier protein] reductase